MRALVVYESMFGNTELVARAVATGLREAGATVTVSRVDEADPATLTEYDVVVAGAPTHALSMPRASTREDAVRQGAAPEHHETGLREWLDGLEPAVGERPAFAVFDTRVGVGAVRHLSGSAARRAARALRRRKGTLADAPTSFFVGGTSGPLLPGEEDRASAWGARLGRVTASLG